MSSLIVGSHAIEQTQSRVDGVGRLKFDFAQVALAVANFPDVAAGLRAEPLAGHVVFWQFSRVGDVFHDEPAAGDGLQHLLRRKGRPTH